MGKGKKGKKEDLEKKAALQAKKEAKQEKAARKRLAKQQGLTPTNDDDDEDLDQVLQAYKSQDHTKKESIDKPSLESIDTPFPLPRANASFEFCIDDKKDYFYLFGGEYFDGIENVVLDELLRFEAQKQEWKLIRTAPRPPPRCAHSCVSYKQCLYVFGGEMATADQYHHYKDIWKFDSTTLKWTEIMARNPPSARSGHACFVWKSFMIVFGGFFEALREIKFFNDVHVFNLQTETWMDVPMSRLAAKPEPRSACNFASFGTDKVIFHGGFSKLKTSSSSTAETKVHSDSWILHLTPLLQQKPPTWERWMSSSKGITSWSANGRAGTSSASYKNRMLVFGGVVDSEQQHHMVDSIFYNDLMALDIERRKWFPLKMKSRAGAGGGRRRRQEGGKDGNNDENNKADDDAEKESNNDDGSDGNSDLEEELGDDDDDEKVDSGWGLDTLRANMFAFVDGDGNIVFEKIEDTEQHENEETKEGDDEDADDDDNEEEEKDEEKEEQEKEEAKEEGKVEPIGDAEKETTAVLPRAKEAINTRKITSSSVLTLNPETNAPEAVQRTEPLPRINASIVVRGHMMYILGGILEVGDREVTLDDMWAADLRKRDKWECLFEGTMHKQIWRGVVHDDDDSYISTSKGDESDDEYEDEEESDVEGEFVSSQPSDDKQFQKSEKASSKKSKRAGLRQEIAELNEKYSLDNENRTPNRGESLADFYSRTSEYWNGQAAEKIAGTDKELSNKELKREGFSLARERYDELKPILERLAELDIGDKNNSSKDEKKKKEKSKKRNSSSKR